MDEKKIRFDFEARYFTAGTLDPSTRQVWVVLHGYGQLASYFLKKFEPLVSQNIFIVAPEGLSRFYLSELTSAGRPDNKVGATWMTREGRETDIDNYIRYLDTVYNEALAGNTAPVTLFAFSQGCATVCRWAVEGRPSFDRLILWAGLFPPDMNFSKGHQILSTKENYMVIGDQDPFLTPERLNEFDQLATKLDIQPTKLTFPGKHELNLELMQQLAK